MATYTTVADGNGDFAVSFPASYTGGEKITVTSEKDAATKTIEIYAPSDFIGRDVLFNLTNFPDNIGAVELTSEISGVLHASRFDGTKDGSIWRNATSLKINGAITEIPVNSLRYWVSATSLELPSTLGAIGQSAISSWTSCIELICKAPNPPIIGSFSLHNLNPNCIIKVPAASVAAYQAAPNWSAFAARIQAI